jgi:hypothetical protein
MQPTDSGDYLSFKAISLPGTREANHQPPQGAASSANNSLLLLRDADPRTSAHDGLQHGGNGGELQGGLFSDFDGGLRAEKQRADMDVVDKLERERVALESRANQLRVERDARSKKISMIAKEIEALEAQELQRKANRKPGDTSRSLHGLGEASRPVSGITDVKAATEDLEEKFMHKQTQTTSSQEDAIKELSHVRAENIKFRQMIEDMKKSNLLSEQQLQTSTDEKMNLILAHEEVWKLAKNLQGQLKQTLDENNRLKKKLVEQSSPPKYGSSADKYRVGQDKTWANDSGHYGSTLQSREVDIVGSEGNIKMQPQGWRSEHSLGADFLYLPAIKKSTKVSKDGQSQAGHVSPSKGVAASQISPMRSTVKSIGGVSSSTNKLSKDKMTQEAAYKANLAKLQSPTGLAGYKLWLLDTKDMDFLKDPKTLKQRKTSQAKQ